MPQPNLITIAKSGSKYAWHVFGHYFKHSWYVPNVEDEQYAIGELPPRYSVPAIRIEAWLDVHAWPNEVLPTIIVQENDDNSYTEIWPNDYRR